MLRIAIALMIGAMMHTAPAEAEGSAFSALARVRTEASGLDDTRDGLRLRLELSQGVPFRAFTLADPPRLVLDFREVDWGGVDPRGIDRAERARAVRVGGFRPGWSRMVVDLAGPFAIGTATATTDRVNGTATIEVVLTAVDESTFAARSGAPPLPGWEHEAAKAQPAARRAHQTGDQRLLVVLDPGHGGIDPGAEREDHSEKALMLQFARELREALLRAGGFEVVLTREADEFVSLERRVALAHEAGADIFLSLHADALSEGRAHGATVYTLSDSASDAASAALAERHDRANILAGIDLSDSDDVVADVLIDLSRMETQPRSENLARAIALGIEAQGLPLHPRPLRRAGFSVLKSPDIPSVLIELGFLSSDRDRDNLLDPDWRARMAAGIRDALVAWRIADAAAARLVRQ